MLLWRHQRRGRLRNAPATFAVDVKAVGTPKDFNYLTDVTA